MWAPAAGRAYIHPSIHILSARILRCITHSFARSLARSLISFFPIIIKRAAKGHRQERISLCATPEVRRRAPSVPQSRPPAAAAQVSLTPCEPRTFHIARPMEIFHHRILGANVLRTCSQRFGPLASDRCDGLVFPSSSRHRERGDFQENILSLSARHYVSTQTWPWEMRLLQNCVLQKDGNYIVGNIVTHQNIAKHSTSELTEVWIFSRT